ncbi:MAG: Xaa-Pro peptidase family protein [Nanoarchaeota archaeon]
MNPFNKRLKEVQMLMSRAGLNAVLTTSLNNILYYTGAEMLQGERAFLVISKSGNIDLFVSPLVNFLEGLKTANIHFLNNFKDLKKVIAKHKKIGYDERSISVNLYKKLNIKGVRFYPAGDITRKPREIKDSTEISSITKAIKVTESVLKNIKFGGKTEFQTTADVDYGFRERGALNAFETIVSSGKRTALIHCTPQNKKIQKNDMVLIDCGAKVNGYCADMTRMFCKKPDKKQRLILEDVVDTQKSVIDKITEGVNMKNVDNHYKKLMNKKGYQVFHSFGHGVGINVHEGPFNGELKSGMILTVEPGVYIKGFGGCRIEDMVLVRKDKPKILSVLPRSF